ncbi:hypothetical protein [Mycolicibacterium cosmeticum]|uniref:hypothetical protein n=1 Tax=Mycolicibacterium cosmeticum TaxID=258533 RepID=UPI003204D418
MRNDDPGEKSEEDVTDDPHVAASRASADGDGAYVGRTNPDDAIDAEESGAEARAD